MVDVRTNLLKKRRTLSEKDYQQEQKYLRYSVLAMVMTVVIVVALSVWNFVLTRQLSGVEKALLTSATELQGLSQASAQQVYLASRLKLVTGFLSGRALASEALQKVLSTNLPGTHVGGVAFEEDSSLNVQFVANTVPALNQLLDYYQADTGYFVQAVSRGMNKSKDGEYQIIISLIPPKGSE